ncbi:hypothetical protein PsYK624_168530 [Phanerochaete sordida]|uniref:Uncharacterized protein n=1 Tax=Phanerochaete sordida TaxID=48140 RepID=A0A9P3GTT5_9APHY|nr:hypothetical protein PsYK624_168530 [Phanerochaete sordida]
MPTTTRARQKTQDDQEAHDRERPAQEETMQEPEPDQQGSGKKRPTRSKKKQPEEHEEPEPDQQGSGKKRPTRSKKKQPEEHEEQEQVPQTAENTGGTKKKGAKRKPRASEPSADSAGTHKRMRTRSAPQDATEPATPATPATPAKDASELATPATPDISPTSRSAPQDATEPATPATPVALPVAEVAEVPKLAEVAEVPKLVELAEVPKHAELAAVTSEVPVTVAMPTAAAKTLALPVAEVAEVPKLAELAEVPKHAELAVVASEVPVTAAMPTAAAKRPAEKHVTTVPEQLGLKLVEAWSSQKELRVMEDGGKVLKEKSDNQYFVHVWDGETTEGHPTYTAHASKKIAKLEENDLVRYGITLDSHSQFRRFEPTKQDWVIAKCGDVVNLGSLGNAGGSPDVHLRSMDANFSIAAFGLWTERQPKKATNSHASGRADMQRSAAERSRALQGQLSGPSTPQLSSPHTPSVPLSSTPPLRQVPDRAGSRGGKQQPAQSYAAPYAPEPMPNGYQVAHRTAAAPGTVTGPLGFAPAPPPVSASASSHSAVLAHEPPPPIHPAAALAPGTDTFAFAAPAPAASSSAPAPFAFAHAPVVAPPPRNQALDKGKGERDAHPVLRPSHLTIALTSAGRAEPSPGPSPSASSSAGPAPAAHAPTSTQNGYETTHHDAGPAGRGPGPAPGSLGFAPASDGPEAYQPPAPHAPMAFAFTVAQAATITVADAAAESTPGTSVDGSEQYYDAPDASSDILTPRVQSPLPGSSNYDSGRDTLDAAAGASTGNAANNPATVAGSSRLYPTSLHHADHPGPYTRPFALADKGHDPFPSNSATPTTSASPAISISSTSSSIQYLGMNLAPQDPPVDDPFVPPVIGAALRSDPVLEQLPSIRHVSHAFPVTAEIGYTDLPDGSHLAEEESFPHTWHVCDIHMLFETYWRTPFTTRKGFPKKHYMAFRYLFGFDHHSTSGTSWTRFYSDPYNTYKTIARNRPDLLNKYVNYGCTRLGLWPALVAEYEANP